MGINILNSASNLSSNILNDVDTLRDSGKMALENILGTLQTGLSNVFDGGFAGLDEANYSTLENAINNYVKNIQGIVADFNPENAGIDIAYKGDVRLAVDEFLAAIKLILQAYVSTMKVEIVESKTAFEKWNQDTKKVAGNVSSNAEQISTNAKKISLD